jgi:hypothetical protein
VIQADPRESRLGVFELTLSAGDRESGIQAYRWEVYRILEEPNVAWASSTWKNSGAPDTGDFSRLVVISGFPAPGTQYNNLYEIRLWVRNRSGLVRAAEPITIEVIPMQEEGDEEPTIQLRPGVNLPGGGGP